MARLTIELDNETIHTLTVAAEERANYWREAARRTGDSDFAGVMHGMASRYDVARIELLAAVRKST